VLWWKHVEGRVNNKNQKTGKDETYPTLQQGSMFKMRRSYA
jgi:hypothetical protein